MSQMSIAPWFSFRRVKISAPEIAAGKQPVRFRAVPDRRFTPRCHLCGAPCRGVHQSACRTLRDLDLAGRRVLIETTFRKLKCPRCAAVRMEELEFFDPYQRVTRRLARYIHGLCALMTVADVARHLELDWKTVKEIDQQFLEQSHAATELRGAELLAFDEIAVKKGQRYMTVVLDFETGRVIWMGEGRSSETLDGFFAPLKQEERARIKAVALDMWDPFIKAVRQWLPQAKIVFDLFHVVSAFNKVIDQVRRAEHQRAHQRNKDVYQGARYLLLKKHQPRKKKPREQLAALLALNQTISQTLVLRDMLPQIWDYKSRAWAAKKLREWTTLARQVEHPAVRKFARTLEHYQEGILNHCEYPIHTSKLEGVNNKIKVLKRTAYGYHDTRYFTLKVKQAFDPRATPQAVN